MQWWFLNKEFEPKGQQLSLFNYKKIKNYTQSHTWRADFSFKNIL